MADRIGIVNKGRLLLVEDKAALMGRFGKKTLTIYLTRPVTASCRQPLRRDGLKVAEAGHALVYEYDTQAERSGVARLIADLAASGLAIRDLATEQSSLEEVFLSLVDEDGGEGAEDAA